MTVNHHTANAAHPRTTNLRPGQPTEAPVITEQPCPDDAPDRCEWAIPGTDIRCTRHTHPPQAACTASGVRNGVRFNAVFWREDQR
jgi:hypothetical protein